MRCGCTRMPRRGWTTEMYLQSPIGVQAFVTRSGRPRFHATYACAGATATPLGCFCTIGEAADAWDTHARRRGDTYTNRPRATERSILGALRAAYVSAARFPLPPTDRAWRTLKFEELMQSVRTGGVDGVWASPRDLQQADHASAPGTQLAFSYQPHVFETCKALSCEPGWQHRTCASARFRTHAARRRGRPSPSPDLLAPAQPLTRSSREPLTRSSQSHPRVGPSRARSPSSRVRTAARAAFGRSSSLVAK